MFKKHLPLLILALTFLGCSSGQDTADFDVKGLVTFDGEPVPVGYIKFVPVDNDGIQGYARIEKGRYDTSTGGSARGIQAGEHLVKIVGYDGVAYEDEENEVNGNGTLLFSQYQVKKTFMAEDSQFDVKIPR